MKFSIALIPLLLNCSVATADLFQCKLPDGSTVFSDTGCNDAELVQQKALPRTEPTTQPDNIEVPVAGARQGCSDEDKKNAQAHFDNAEELLLERSKYGDLTSRYRELTARYKHEMSVGKTTLAACSGTAMPEEKRPQRLRAICTTMNGTTICN